MFESNPGGGMGQGMTTFGGEDRGSSSLPPGHYAWNLMAFHCTLMLGFIDIVIYSYVNLSEITLLYMDIDYICDTVLNLMPSQCG